MRIGLSQKTRQLQLYNNTSMGNSHKGRFSYSVELCSCKYILKKHTTHQFTHTLLLNDGTFNLRVLQAEAEVLRCVGNDGG